MKRTKALPHIFLLPFKQKNFILATLFLSFSFLKAQISTTCVPSVSIATSAASVCINHSATYTVSGGVNYTFSANPPTSPAFTSTTGVVTPTTHTNYQVIGTNQFGCTSIAQAIIMINAPPSITVARSASLVCVGAPATLVANSSPVSPAHTYIWTHGGTGSVSIVNPLTNSVFTVTGTNTITNCQNNQTVSISVFAPTFTTISDTSTCINVSITLVASGAFSYSWTGGPSSSVSPYYVVTPTFATIYTVSATSQTVGTLKCIISKTISVTVHNQPTVTAFASRTVVCNNVVFTLWANGAELYYWPTINQSGGTVTLIQNKQTKYKVIGTNGFGCKDTTEIVIFHSSDCWDDWLGLNEFGQNQVRISVFPNPTDESITLDAPGPMKLNLANFAGQAIKEIHIISSGMHTVFTDDLSVGVYFLTGYFESGIVAEKVIIRR